MPDRAIKFVHEQVELIDEAELDRPNSKEEAKGTDQVVLREREAYRPTKHQFIRYLANFAEEATKNAYALSLEGWAKVMTEGAQVSPKSASK